MTDPLYPPGHFQLGVSLGMMAFGAPTRVSARVVCLLKTFDEFQSDAVEMFSQAEASFRRASDLDPLNEHFRLYLDNSKREEVCKFYVSSLTELSRLGDCCVGPDAGQFRKSIGQGPSQALGKGPRDS